MLKIVPRSKAPLCGRWKLKRDTAAPGWLHLAGGGGARRMTPEYFKMIKRLSSSNDETWVPGYNTRCAVLSLVEKMEEKKS